MTKYLKVRAPYSDQCFSHTPNNFFPEQSYYHCSWPNIYAPSGLHPLRPWLWRLQGSDWGWRLRCCFLAWRRCNSQSRCHRRKPSWGCPLFGYARLSSLVLSDWYKRWLFTGSCTLDHVYFEVRPNISRRKPFIFKEVYRMSVRMLLQLNKPLVLLALTMVA